MLTFAPIGWTNDELRRMGGIATAAKRNIKCPSDTTVACNDCSYNHLCALMRDIQIMCKKELSQRMREIDFK